MRHDFGGDNGTFLHGQTLDVNNINSATWQSTTTGTTTFRADGEVVGTSAIADRGAWLPLASGTLQEGGVYKLTVNQQGISNSALFAGFQSHGGTPNLNALGQAQGLLGAGIHIRGFSGGQRIQAYKHVNGSESTVRATDLGFATPGVYQTVFRANNLTDATASVGNATVTFDASNLTHFFLAFDDNGTSTGKFNQIWLQRLLVLPHEESYSVMTPGTADGQVAGDATVGASIVEQEGTPVLAITATTPPAEVCYGLHAPEAFGNILWLETSVRPTATLGRAQFLDLDGILVALVKEGNDVARFYAYDGKLGLANGSGIWKPLGQPVEINAATLLSTPYSLITIRADYQRHRYDVWLDGELVAVNLGFDDASIQKPDALVLYGQTSGVNYFGDLLLSDLQPASLPVSSAGDGIPDAWKNQYGLSLVDPTLRDSVDATGLSLVEKYFYGLAADTTDLSALLGRVELPGGFYREVWTSLPGRSQAQLIAGTRDFQKAPDVVTFSPGAEAPRNYADNYGQRLRGYIILPEAGTYNFFLTADDSAELWLSPDGSKWSRVKAAAVPSATGIYTWDKFPTQKSTDYTLPAGHRLYVEIRHKENTGSDYARLGWVINNPSATSPSELVPAAVLSSYVLEANDQDDDDLPDDWESAHNLNPADNGTGNPNNGKHGTNSTVGLTNHLCWKLGLNPHTPDISALLGQVSVEGVLQREVWLVGGSYLADLTGNAAFAAPPPIKTFTPPEGISNWGTGSYGQRWRGWLSVPVTGAYQLRISSYRGSQLWLSSDDTVMRKRRVAVSGNTTLYGNSTSEQTTQPLYLEAGQRYYVEVLHKYAGPGDTDHCELSWSGPETDGFVPLPPQHVSSWVEDVALTQLGYGVAWVNDTGLAARPVAQQLPNADPDGDKLSNWEEYRMGSNPLIADHNTISRPGAWVRDVWTSGVQTGALPANLGLLYTPPSIREIVQGGDGFASQKGDMYVARSRGLLLAPQTGWYRFALSAEETGEVWLFGDATVNQAKRIASAIKSGWDDFASDPLQVSQPVYLESGQSYYLETRHYEYGGDDYFQLVWTAPEHPDEWRFIPASAMATYVPPVDDPQGWGYPQSWLAGTGLDQLPLEQQVPTADPTGGGLTNLEKYNLGLNPLALDTDGDGISDWEEVYLVGSNAAVADFDGTAATLVTVNGADFLSPSSGTVGTWQKTGTSAYATDLRGSLAYSITLAENDLPNPEILRLLITGGQYLPESADKTLSLDVYVNNGYVGRVTLDLGKLPDSPNPNPGPLAATAALWLPELAAGTHTVRLVWLNGVTGTALRVDQLALEKRGGTWLAARQGSLSHVDATAAVSYTSPYCLEGRTPDSTVFQITADYIPDANATDAYSVFIRERHYLNPVHEQSEEGQPTGTLKTFASLRGTFYSDVPLSPTTATQITWADHGTGAQGGKTLTWQPYNLAEHDGETLYLRVGDSLLFQSDEDIHIVAPIGTETTLLSSSFLVPTSTMPFVFAENGVYQVSAGTATLTVRAIGTDLSPEPTVIMGQTRRWTPTLLADEAVLFYDEQLYLTDISRENGKRSLGLLSTLGAEQHLIARLGEAGPILDSITVNTLIKYGNTKSTWDIVETYPDGTQLWRGQLNYGGILPEGFRVVITPYKSGVTFLDGTLILELTRDDFDASGMYTYYILRAPNTGGAPCHYIYIYDGDARISRFEL